MLKNHATQCFVDVGNSTRESSPRVKDATRPSTVEKNVRALRGVKVTNSEFWCSTRDTDEGGGERTERDIMDPILHINFKLWTKLAICGLFLMGTMRLRLGSAQALLLKFHQSRESGEEREGKGEEFAGAWPRYCSTTTLGPGAHD